MKKHATPLSAIITGIGIGTPVTLLCMSLLGGYNEVIREFLIWAVASALYGLVSYLLFYRFANLSFPVSMALHCAGCLLITSAAAFFCGYVDSFFAMFAYILPVFVIIYIAVSVFCFSLFKQEENKINQALEKK